MDLVRAMMHDLKAEGGKAQMKMKIDPSCDSHSICSATVDTSDSSLDLIVGFPQGPRMSSFSKSSQRGRVSFANHVEVKYAGYLLEYKESLWYSREEIKSIKCQSATLLRKITDHMTMAEYAEINSGDTSAFLGMENYLSPTTTKEIRCRRITICVMVLLEQERQSRSGVNDPERIAQVARGVSEASAVRARIIGLLHAERKDPKRTSAATSLGESHSVPAEREER